MSGVGTAGEHEVLSVLSELDRTIFEADPFTLDADAEAALRLRLVLAAVRHQLEHNARYARYAERLGFEPDAVDSVEQLARVPQLPSTLFKRVDVVTGPRERIVKRCVSSGTAGSVSVVWRDGATLERLVGSLRASIDTMLGHPPEDDVLVVHLGPDAREASDLWFAYVMSLVELAYPTLHAVRDGSFDVRGAWRAVQRACAERRQVVVLGPPPLVASLAAVADWRGTRPGGRLHVVTGGGWKRDAATAIARPAFARRVCDALRIDDERSLRDGFNQVELNTVLLECDAHRKHVPPWLHVVVRDPRTLAPLPPGEAGLLSYLDASATSYPCFLLAEDFGLLHADRCACGRPAATVAFIRRVERAESWGCALKMANAFDPDGRESP